MLLHRFRTQDAVGQADGWQRFLSMRLGHTGIIVSARTASRRLPGKALLPLNGQPMILYLLERLKPLQGAHVVLATTELSSDDALAEVVTRAGVPVFRGSAEDLVARHVAAAEAFGFDTVGRVTADCPFVNAEMVDYCLSQTATLDHFDLATTKGVFPVGLDIEIYNASIMARLHENTDLTGEEREHLTMHLYKGGFDVRHLAPRADWPVTDRTFTVDTREDHERAAGLAGRFSSAEFSLSALLESAAT
jgi:spore coat polysaccharide biosynthesis protein SpsF